MTASAATAPGLTLDVEYATTVLADKGFHVGGRDFAVIERPTFRQAAYLEKWKRACKVDEMLKNWDAAKDAEVSEFVAGLIVESFESDAIFHLLAGGLVEVKNGQRAKWAVANADALAEWLANVDDPADQRTLQKAILGVVASFFLSRLVSLAASRSSSSEPTAEPTDEPSVAAEAAPANEPRSATSRPSFDAARSAPPADLADRILASVPLMPTETSSPASTSSDPSAT